MKSTIRRSQRDYSLAFKLSVVDQVERGELTYKKAQERYGIRGRESKQVLPASPVLMSITVNWSSIPNETEIGHGEALSQKTDHRLPA